MPAFRFSRFLLLPLVATAVLLSWALFSIGAQAQWKHGAFKYRWVGTVPIEEISSADVMHALVWTGHLGIGLDKAVPTDPKAAMQSWQKSKKYPVTDELTSEQKVELVRQGLRKRDSFGWAILRDDAIGFEVGIPAALVERSPPQNKSARLSYYADGEVSHFVHVYYGASSCPIFGTNLQRMDSGTTAWVKLDDGFVLMGRVFETVSVARAICHSSGMVLSGISMPASNVAKEGVMLTALAYSLRVKNKFNATALPKPKLEEFPFASMGLPDDDPLFSPSSAPAAETGKRDPDGKIEGIKLESKDGPDLRTDEVFEKVSGAVYVVKVRKGQGSAVAVSEDTLLTNCHVVGDQNEVRLIREKEEMKAQVVSGKTEADRCVLKVDRKLPHWVGVRAYDDVKVGERAVTIGAPFGLELTAADGVISSKRTMRGNKLLQTSAPVSPGSSGGGLFDARGNLIGITTFIMTVGQNLNFAVAADEFMKEGGSAQVTSAPDRTADPAKRRTAR